MDDQTDPSSEEGEYPLSVWIRGEGRVVGPHLLDGSGGKGSMDDRNVDTGLFKYGARLLWSPRARYGKRAGDAFTALGPSPAIAIEFWSRWVELLEAGYDAVLKIDDVFCDLITKSNRHFVGRKWMSGWSEGRDDQAMGLCIISAEPSKLYSPGQDRSGICYTVYVLLEIR